jgi:hypothetical protein
MHQVISIMNNHYLLQAAPFRWPLIPMMTSHPPGFLLCPRRSFGIQGQRYRTTEWKKRYSDLHWSLDKRSCLQVHFLLVNLAYEHCRSAWRKNLGKNTFTLPMYVDINISIYTSMSHTVISSPSISKPWGSFRRLQQTAADYCSGCSAL